MANEEKKTPLTAPHKKEGFRGYTIKELRQQRLLAQVRMEFLKERMVNDAKSLKGISLMPGKGKTAGLLSLAGKGLKLFSYADLFALGIAAFRSGWKLYSIFRHRK